MKRTNVVIDSNKAGAIISEASEDQKRYFDDLVDGMKATINDKFADIDSSIQKVQASLSENKALVMKNYLNIGESVLEIRTLLAEKKERPTINWKIYPSIELLLLYFKTLFFGEFRERDQDEIELKEVCAEEFLHLLKVLYPPFNDDDIDSKNVEGLLRLADRYQVKAVSHRCSQYLKKCALSEVSLGEKMLHAQNYHLSELVEHCIKEECKTVDDVKKLRATSHYSLLDKDIKLQIHEILLE
uniref:BTB domain-containing protein n=1 Tax=Ditylenchus dipsaci TaxID=166011 RepID=A0A915DJY3_9BILA